MMDKGKQQFNFWQCFFSARVQSWMELKAANIISSFIVHWDQNRSALACDSLFFIQSGEDKLCTPVLINLFTTNKLKSLFLNKSQLELKHMRHAMRKPAFVMRKQRHRSTVWYLCSRSAPLLSLHRYRKYNVHVFCYEVY